MHGRVKIHLLGIFLPSSSLAKDLVSGDKIIDVSKPGTQNSSKQSGCSELTCSPASVELPSLLGIDIESVSEGLASVTSVDLVKAYLTRIAETREFNAVLQLNPNAATIVKSLDEESARFGSRG